MNRIWLRIILGLLLAASIAGNVWSVIKLRADQSATDYAFRQSTWYVTVSMKNAIGSLDSAQSAGSWLAIFQMTQNAYAHARAGAQMQPLMYGKKRVVAEQYTDLSFELLEFNYIIGQLESRKGGALSRRAVANWEKLYNQIEWPGDVEDSDEYWESLHRSLEQFLRGVSELSFRCVTNPVEADPPEDNPPAYRYGCE